MRRSGGPVRRAIGGRRSSRRVRARGGGVRSARAGVVGRCPCCSGRGVAPEQSLAALEPALAAEWDRQRNGELEPSQLLAGSGRKVWWRGCANRHPPWLASPRDRLRGHGCPYCAGEIVISARSLAATCPELASDWHS